VRRIAERPVAYPSKATPTPQHFNSRKMRQR
jgi:hypothetical protein